MNKLDRLKESARPEFSNLRFRDLREKIRMNEEKGRWRARERERHRKEKEKIGIKKKGNQRQEEPD